MRTFLAGSLQADRIEACIEGGISKQTKIFMARCFLVQLYRCVPRMYMPVIMRCFTGRWLSRVGLIKPAMAAGGMQETASETTTEQ
jgi:hypothetical protein